MNPMQQIKVEKVTINIGSGKDQKKLEKGIKLIKSIVGIEPVKTVTQKRIPGWGLRPGLPIGCKLTLRKAKALDILKRLLYAKDFKLEESQFDNAGSLSFGIPEYIDIEGAEYDPQIGIMGLQVSVTLEKPGFRIKKRCIRKKKIGRGHVVSKDEAIAFMKSSFNIKIGADEEE